MTGTPEYRAWHKMLERCYDPKCVRFEYWGGRGIKVCDAWRGSFESFFAHMGKRPDGRSLDRINNDGNYEPGNCRWATSKEQRANRRDSFKR